MQGARVISLVVKLDDAPACSAIEPDMAEWRGGGFHRTDGLLTESRGAAPPLLGHLVGAPAKQLSMCEGPVHSHEGSKKSICGK